MQKSIAKNLKRFLLLVMLVLGALVFVYWDLLVYGINQAKGQLTIIWNATPVEQVLEDSNFPDSLKSKLKLIAEARRYAVDSLGLKDTENYKTVYDQKGKELMWVVTACEPFSFTPKEWKFPVVGTVPYKGFFDSTRAFVLRNELVAEGWDTSIRNPGGWSTLGWFTDPILSKMLERSEGDLANLIIHEMVHVTIFVKDSVEYNENLASFIGDRGAERFLLMKYGKASKEYDEYLREDRDFTKYINHMLLGISKLDSLYKSMGSDISVEAKTERKQVLIKRIVEMLDTLELSSKSNLSIRFKEKLPNNAYFMNVIRYQSKQDFFWVEFTTDFKGDVRMYIQYLTKKHPFL
jgi:predicted aminopeptidase